MKAQENRIFEVKINDRRVMEIPATTPILEIIKFIDIITKDNRVIEIVECK